MFRSDVDKSNLPKSIFHVPYDSNPHFTGHESLFRMLQKKLSETRPKRYSQRVAIYGLGGVGKTQIRFNTAITIARIIATYFGLRETTLRFAHGFSRNRHSHKMYRAKSIFR